MKNNVARILGFAAVAGVVALAGCGKKSDSEPTTPAGVVESTGAALDTAAEKTGEAATKAAEAAKNVAGQVVEKTGEVIEKAGSSVDKAGEGMQK